MTLAEVMIVIFDLYICYVIFLHRSLQPEMLKPEDIRHLISILFGHLLL